MERKEGESKSFSWPGSKKICRENEGERIETAT